MATNIDALNATTLKEIYPRVIRDVFFKSTPFLSYLRNNVVPFSGGVSMDHTFMYDALIGGAYAKGDSFNLSKPEILAALTFQPKLYFTNVSEYLEDVEIFNKGPQAVFSRVDADLQNAINTLNTIIAVAIWRHGQASGSNVADDRSKHINGLAEAINDGVSLSWDGNKFATYGGETRTNVGTVLNSVPRWVGDTSGATGQISYNILEESYQDACRGREEPNLIVANKAAIAFVKERMQAQQRFAQEADPMFGATGFKFNNAMVLKDDYAPSAASQYGVNDAKLGDYSTSTSAASGTGNATKSRIPNSQNLTIGEVMFMLNTNTWEFRVSDSPIFGFGFRGFIDSASDTRVSGQVLAGCNVKCLDNQLNKVIFGIGS